MKCEEAKQTGRKEGEGVLGRRRMRRFKKTKMRMRRGRGAEGSWVEGEKEGDLGRGRTKRWVGERGRRRGIEHVGRRSS